MATSTTTTAARATQTQAGGPPDPPAPPRAGGRPEGDDLACVGGQEQPRADARRREVVGDRADGRVGPDGSGGRIEPVEHAVAADRPHEPRRRDWWPAADRRAPPDRQACGCRRDAYG